MWQNPESNGLAIIVLAFGMLAQFVLYLTKIRSYQIADKKAKREDEKYLQDLIKQVCKEFTQSDEYLLRRDRSQISVAQAVMDEGFRIRSPSFVDMKAYEATQAEIQRRLGALEQIAFSIRSDIKNDFKDAANELIREMEMKERVRG